MTMHERWTDQISNYLDGELPLDARQAFESHVATCSDCAATLERVRRVVVRAGSLLDDPPAADLWPGIATAIAGSAPGVTPMRRTRRRVSFSVPQLAAAAAVIMALTGGSVWLLQPQPGIPVAAVHGTAAGSAAPGSGSTAAVLRNASSGPTAEQSYDAAVADLQQALVAGEGRLDTATVRVVQKNLATIDSAVAGARAAVRADPANSYLNTYLAHTMRRKIDLLRQVVALTSAQS